MHANSKGGQQSSSKEEVERKKSRFREFLKLMGKGQQKDAQTWNDQFESFMELQEVPKYKEKDLEEGKAENEEAQVTEKATESEFVDDKRLFLMNLSYQVTQEEL